MVLFGSFANSCVNNEIKRKEKINLERIERRNIIYDSLEKIQIKNDSIVHMNRCKFDIEKHNFGNDTIIWIYPLKEKKNNNMYCYFSLRNGIPTSNFRFVFQNYSNTLLSIESIIFNIDGKSKEIYVKDCVRNKISENKTYNVTKEWFDVKVLDNIGYNVNFYLINDIANAKSVRIKINGNNFNKEHQLSEAQIKNIKETYDLYWELRYNVKLF